MNFKFENEEIKNETEYYERQNIPICASDHTILPEDAPTK
jgi:hypothetical protein